MTNNFLQDSKGNKSSKRLWGSILLCSGIIFPNILFAYSLYQGAADAATALGIINMFLISGGGLLGMGVFEKEINIKKNDRRINNKISDILGSNLRHFWLWIFLKAKNQKKLSNLKIILVMQKNLKRGELIVGIIAFLLLSAGCKNTSVNNLCLWANSITIAQSELNSLSEETLRQIDNFNQEFEERCG